MRVTRARRTGAATVITAMVLIIAAGCGGASTDGDATTASTSASQVAVSSPPVPSWVPRGLRDRVVDLGPGHPRCGILYNGRHSKQWGLYVSGGARCRTGLLVLASFDAHLSKVDLTPRCNYLLCPPKSRTYRGYRCRLVHSFDDDYVVLCNRGRRKIGLESGN
jgi:hypothetical protein